MPGSLRPDRLKTLRTERGWSQAELAEHIDSDARQVSGYENGKVAASPEAATRIAETFNVTLDYPVLDDAPAGPARPPQTPSAPAPPTLTTTPATNAPPSPTPSPPKPSSAFPTSGAS